MGFYFKRIPNIVFESSTWSDNFPSLSSASLAAKIADKHPHMAMFFENVEVDPTWMYHDAVQPLEIFDNSTSTMSSYSVNEVSRIQLNDKSYVHNVDRWRQKDVTKTLKTVNQVKSKRGCYIRYV